MGPHCTVRPERLLVAIWMTLTLEPIKSLCTISTLRLVFLAWWSRSVTFRGCAIQSLGGPGVWYSLDGQSVALWEDVFRKSLCLLNVPWDWLSSSDFVGVSNHIFKAWNRAILDVCGSQSDSSELPLVTPLAFSNLALALLGGTLLMGGCSGIEVLLIFMLHWSLFAAIAFCWFSKLLVTTLPCCSLTAWMASCIVLWIIAISGVGEYTVLTDKLPDSGDDGLEASLLLGSLLASYSVVISLWEDV